MRQNPFVLIFLLIVTGWGLSQTPTPAPIPSATVQATPAPTAAPSVADLKAALARMDEAARHFKSAQAEFRWEQYTKVVNDTDVQTGRIYSRRKDSSPEVAIEVLMPHPKQVVIKHNKAVMYDPRIKQRTERDIGNNADAQSVMNLAFAFGVRGQDLLRDYDVTWAGWEHVDGIKTAKLELVARKESVRRFFSKAILWIDLDRDVAIQQQRFESSGDYQLAHYTNIRLDEKIPDDVFTIKKSGD